MTTANLSVGINTEKARADLKALHTFMRSQLSSMALSINEKSLEASIKRAMQGPTNGFALRINTAKLKTDLSTALNDAMSGAKVGGGSINTTQLKAGIDQIKQYMATAANDPALGNALSEGVKKGTPKATAAAKEAGKAAGKAFAEGEEEGSKYAKLSHRAKLGAGTLSVSEKSEYTAEEVKAMAEANEQERQQLLLQRQQNQERREAVRLERELLAEKKKIAARMFAEGKNLAPDNLTAKGRAQYGAQYAVSRGVSESMLPNGAAGLLQVTDGLEKGIKKVGQAHTEATGKTKAHTAAMHDAHSAARGLASGMGMMWLTWGNIAPLLAGASLSHGFIQAMKAGSEFAYQLTFVKALGGETSEAVRGIGEAALQMSKNGLYGPVELANGLRVLNQAGISTKDSMMALPQVFDLATVGEMSMADAAITLAGVMTAFNLQVKDMSHIGDVFAKAAAESQTSVEQMTQAMKTASVVGYQYGASMEDTATALTLLAKMNITGTAAGTSLRNMLKELYTPTDKAAKMLKDLGVSAQTATGELKPFPEIIFAMKGKLEEFNKASQVKILQGIFGERGAKEAIAMLSQTREQWDKLNKTVSESEGFMSQVSAELEASTKGSFKKAFNTLQTSLVESFNKTEGAAGQLAVRLQQVFDSGAFKGAVDNILAGMLSLTNALVYMAPALAAVATGWVAVRGAMVVASVWTSVTTAVMGTSAALLAASGAMGPTATGLVGIRAALAALMGPVGWVVTGITAVTTALGYMYMKMRDDAPSRIAAENANTAATAMQNLANKISAATKEYQRLEREKQGKTEFGPQKSGIELREADYSRDVARLEELRKTKRAGRLSFSQVAQLAAMEDNVKSQRDALDKDRAAYKAAQADYKEGLRAKTSGTVIGAEQDITDLPSSGLKPSQVAAKKTAQGTADWLKANTKFIIDNYGEQAAYILDRVTKNLNEQVQDAKIATGTKNLVESGGGGGRADREAGKYESQRLKNVLKDQATIEKLYDSHYKRLIAVENASAAAGLITREQAEEKISELTEEQTNARIQINEGYHAKLKEMLASSDKLSESQREQIEGEMERRGLLLLELQEEVTLKRELANIASKGSQEKFNKDIGRAQVDLDKLRKEYAQKTLGDGMNASQRARSEGSLRAEERYAQLLKDAQDQVDTANYGGNPKAIEAATARLQTLNGEIEKAKQSTGAYFEEIYNQSQTAAHGWNKFWENYQEQGTTAAKVVEQSMESVTKNLEDAFSKAFETGKFDAQAMFKAIMGDVGRLTAKMAVSDLGNILFGKGKSSGEILGTGKANDSFTGVLNPVVDGLKKFWGSLTGATGATEDATAKTAEGIVKMVTKTSAESTATTSMIQLASAAQMAASQLAMMGGGGGGSGGLLSSLGGGGSSFLPFNANAPLPGAADFVGPMMGASSVASSGALDFMSMIFAANGAAFNSRSLQAFAKGGTFSNSIVNSPTLFRFANGTGLMGEAGPEAIMPLTRDSQGRLGVRYEGREAPQSRGNSNVSNNNINVTVNSKSGDPAEIRRSGAAVARQVANAVAGSGRYR